MKLMAGTPQNGALVQDFPVSGDCQVYETTCQPWLQAAEAAEEGAEASTAEAGAEAGQKASRG